MSEAKRVAVGDIIAGDAGGHFGRDSESAKKCIAAGERNGVRYAIFDDDGAPPQTLLLHALSGPDLAELEAHLASHDRA